VGHVISTEWTSVLTVIVTGQCQTLITATILLVQITVMAPPATNTKRLSEVLVHVPMVLNHTKATVILLTVLIMHMLVLVTSTRSMLAVQVGPTCTGIRSDGYCYYNYDNYYAAHCQYCRPLP